MSDIELSGELNWYRVYVDDKAQFITQSYTEDGAKQKIEYYLQQNPNLKIDTLFMFDHGLWTKPLDSFDVDYYDKVNHSYSEPVRLVEYSQNIPIQKFENELDVKNICVNPEQLCLFSITKYPEYRYSYYSE